MSFTGSLSLISLFDDINAFSRRFEAHERRERSICTLITQNFYDIKFLIFYMFYIFLHIKKIFCVTLRGALDIFGFKLRKQRIRTADFDEYSDIRRN